MPSKKRGADSEAPPPIPPSLMDSVVQMDEEPERTELDKIFEQLLSPENIKHNTELNQREILAFTTLGNLATRYKLRHLQEWLVENLTLRVSHKRRGKGELVKMLTRHIQEDQERQRMMAGAESGRFSRMMGRRGRE